MILRNFTRQFGKKHIDEALYLGREYILKPEDKNNTIKHCRKLQL